MPNEFIARNGITSLGNIIVSGSITSTGAITISGSIASASFATTAATASSADNLLVRSTLTAQTLVVQTITSSISTITGSTNFGSTGSNTHTFTGSLNVTGGFTVNGSTSTFNGGSGSMRVFINRAQNTSSFVSSIIFSTGGTGVGNGFSEIGSIEGAGDLYFNTDSIQANYTRRMIIQGSTGNVGIGTTNPTARLHVSGTTGGIFEVDGAAAINALYVSASGNVGIGTITPLYQFDISTSNYRSLRIQSSDDALITMGSTIASSQFYSIGVSSNTSGQGSNLFWIGTSTNNPSGILTKNLTITSTGAATFSSTITAGDFIRGTCTTSYNGDGIRVFASTTGGPGSQPGIGFWTAAGSKRFITQLDVSSDTWNVVSATGVTHMTILQSGQVGIKVTPTSGWGSAMAGLQIGTSGALFNWTGANNNLFVGSNAYDDGAGAQKRINATSVSGIAFSDGNIVFRNAASSTANSTISWNDVMRITLGGVIAINNASPNTTYAFGVKLTGTTVRNGIDIINDYEGVSASGVNISCYNNVNGIVTMQVLGNGNLVNYNGSYGTITSDIRLKENIIDATSKLEDIMKLRVVNFNLKQDESKKKQIGFIAQEFKEVFPSLTHTTDTRKYDEDGNVISGYEDSLGLNVGMEFAILVKAIQELKAQNDALTTRIEQLEQQ